jgi:predicted NUDIX family NTP pyrophosphohydrolase
VVRHSAGIVLYRRAASRPGHIEVLLGHPGGPYWATKDEGAWGIPKGEIEPDEEPLAVARREFEEETGHPAPVGGEIPLGEIRKKSGKVVTAWAVAGDLDPATAHSNTFPMEWPPNSGQFIDVPEFDRVAWFTSEEARTSMRGAEWPLVERLVEALETGEQTTS